MELDLTKSGLALVFKDYQEEAMNLIWGDVKYLGSKKENGNKEFSSREVWDHVNRTMTTIPTCTITDTPKTGTTFCNTTSWDRISRASVINFLNAMCDEGVLGCHEITGKGGYRRIYHAQLSKPQFWDKVIVLTSKKLAEASGRPVNHESASLNVETRPTVRLPA